MERRSLEGFPSMCRCRRRVIRGHVCLVLFRAYLFSLLAASSCLHWMLLHSMCSHHMWLWIYVCMLP